MIDSIDAASQLADIWDEPVADADLRDFVTYMLTPDEDEVAELVTSTLRRMKQRGLIAQDAGGAWVSGLAKVGP